MRFLVDVQLPPGLAVWLQQNGHDALSVSKVGLRDGSDSEIWDYALADRRVIVSKDEDFALRSARTDTGPQIVWLRIGNSTNRVLFAWLEPLMPGVINALESGDRLVEVKRI